VPRIAIGIEYEGTRYCGWQRQEHALSIQQVLEEAVSRVADEPVIVNVAGRTDAGVHAAGQVAHFDTAATRDPRSWLLGVNSNLPHDVSVSWAREVAPAFDARYSAVARTYEYLVLNRPARSALWAGRAWWLHGSLDVEAMRVASRCLIGEHDFSAFRAVLCQARSPMRRIEFLDIKRSGPFVRFTVRANAFLHHMVRNLVGSLIRVARGEVPPEWIHQVLVGRDRRAAGMTAPPAGLSLVRVHYPQSWDIPPPDQWPAGDGDL